MDRVVAERRITISQPPRNIQDAIDRLWSIQHAMDTGDWDVAPYEPGTRAEWEDVKAVAYFLVNQVK